MSVRVCQELARAVLCVTILLTSWRDASALNPALDVSQYVHTTWRVRDGFWSGSLNAIAQTPDGYLWLGTDNGLLRFDGVRSVAWQAPPNQALPSTLISSLVAGRDGTLWIGTDKGLASWKDGKLNRYQNLGEGHIGRIVETRDGSLWVTVANVTPPRWILCAIHAGRVECHGADGGPGADAVGLYEDSQGVLWVGTRDGLWQWKPGPHQFYPFPPQPNGIYALADAGGGDLLISMVGGIRRLRNGRVEIAYPFPRSMQDSSANFLLRDRDGGIWIGTSALGLVHVHDGVTDVFGEVDGLSSAAISSMFEDREGNIWVATLDGLDRFREAPAAVFSAKQGLSNSRVQSVLAARDGSVWVGTADGLSRLNGNRMTVYRERSARTRLGLESPTPRDVPEITGRGLPANGVNSLLQDRLGRVWLATPGGIGYIENDRFVAVSGLPAGVTRAIVEDRGNVWVANQDLGLYRVSGDGKITQHLPWSTLNNAPASAVAADARTPGVWLGFGGGGIINVVDGQVRASYGPGDGLAEGFVRNLRLDGDETLWVATDNGLSRVKDGRITTLTRKNGLPCDATQWVTQDAQSFWVGMSCGLVMIARSEVEAWAAVANTNDTDAERTLKVTVFGNTDGVRLFANAVYYSVPAASAADGRLWFMSPGGVSMVDPRHLPFNRASPPVHIEQITADRNTYDGRSIGAGNLRLPPLTRDLQIDYTALSFVAPEKMQFRYMLEGRDRDWHEVGTRRQAYYENLRPGNYRFRVIASNNDGVWNDTGASVDFAIAPAYYQTNWFRALSVTVVVALVLAAHRVRLHIVKKHEREITALNERLMKAQEQERIRIAGELHDGVMQQLLAVTMRLGTAKRRLPDDSDAKGTIDKIQEQLIQVGTDIRQLSHDLHPPMLQDAGLPEAVRAYCEQFSASSGVEVSCDADDQVEDLSRGAALALFRVLQEALGNAAKHAHATRIAVRLTRSADVVTLVVSDDGVGFDSSRPGASGGLGLVMMRERASQLNGKFEFESAPGRGTTIRVVIPFR